jgi:signal transduction histidine kinase
MADGIAPATKESSHSLGENIRLELQVAAVTWPVLIDVSQLESTMLNLSVNARDAMPDGGRLTIEASNVVIDERAFVLNLEATPGDYVLIAVSDTGMGMSADVLAHVFEPFFTTKGETGTGLGMWVSAQLVERLQADLRVSSTTRPGRSGTAFSLFLPLELSR